MTNMEEEIINFIENKNDIYINIDNNISIKKIYDLLTNNIIYEPTNIIENHYLGFYYDKVKYNPD
jgi:hypothetical protein